MVPGILPADNSIPLSGMHTMLNERYEDSHLYKLRHSTAHLMAQAITELYPGAKLAIGPPIENGLLSVS